MQVSMELKVPVAVKKKKDYFVSYCPVLDVHSQGETEEKALDNLVEAISLFLVSCFERGTLDEVLKECGFEPIKKSVKAKPSSKRYKTIGVPIPFQIKHRKSLQQCHV